MLLVGLLLSRVGAHFAAAEPAPTVLYNKTVVLAWTENRSQRSETGIIKHSTTVSDFRVSPACSIKEGNLIANK